MAKKPIIGEININIEQLKKLKGKLFSSKYELYNAVLDNFKDDFRITVERKSKSDENVKTPYIKTKIKPRINDYLMEQIKKHCLLVELGEECIIEEVYETQQSNN